MEKKKLGFAGPEVMTKAAYHGLMFHANLAN